MKAAATRRNEAQGKRGRTEEGRERERGEVNEWKILDGGENEGGTS